MAASVASVYALVFTNYTGVKELYCPATHPVVDIATCDNGGVPILWDQKTLPMPPGTLPNAKWTNYLLPNKENPTGVRCTQLPAFSAQGRLRCRTN